MNPLVLHTRLRRLSIATLLAVVVAGLTLLTAPADAAGIYLHRGSRGAAVHTLETRLAKVAGLPRSAVDRRYTRATVRAVKRFQRARHLRVTGTVNQRTWDLVASAYTQATTPPGWRAPAWRAPQVTAHRGGSREAPENTLAAIRHGVEVGADTVEFDVRSTLDHQLVLLHDRTLDRTTSCTGTVWSLTLAQVQACRTDVGAQPVPTLDEVLTYLQGTTVMLSPEIKDYGLDMTDDEVATFVSQVQSAGLAERTYAQSFDPRVFPLLEGTGMTLVYLSGTVLLTTQVTDAGADVASIAMGKLARANVDTYHAHGIPVYTWTATTEAQLQQAWTLGVDSVGTDIPSAAVRLYR